jgi:hypothetical protein
MSHDPSNAHNTYCPTLLIGQKPNGLGRLNLFSISAQCAGQNARKFLDFFFTT